MSDQVAWVEVWLDLSTLYVLILRENAGRPEIYDPIEKRVIERFDRYEDACSWLWEDEYTRVEGRLTADE
jgi:hypothetical protein